MLQECTKLEDAVAVWWLLTKEQQADEDIKYWFEAVKGQLRTQLVGNNG